MSCLYLTGKCRLAILTALLVSSATHAFAQAMSAPSAPSGATPSKDSISDPVKLSMEPVHGLVARADGSVPEDLIEIHLICGGAAKLIAIPDFKGRFDIVLAELKDIPDPGMCVLRAFLDGYRSETKPLVKGSLIAGAKLGRFVLQPSSSDPTGVASASGEQASKAGKKAYEQALYDAARQYWKNALKSFQKAVLSDPGYSSAWLSLGILQQSSGDREGARKSFAESAQADGKFALPLIRTAVLDAARADWQGTVDYSQKAIDLNPTAFPHAYELNAIGNLYLLKTDAAEKSAAKGLKLDTERRYPELEYALGMILKLKNDREGAAKHFQAYVDEAPSAAHVASVKAELARLQAPH
jgi:hypothetical protein